MGKDKVEAHIDDMDKNVKVNTKEVDRSPEDDKISVPERPNGYFDRKQHMLQAMKLCGILKEEGNGLEEMKVMFHVFGDHISKIDITHLDI